MDMKGKNTERLDSSKQYNFLTLDAFAHRTFDKKKEKVSSKKNMKIVYSVVNQPDD